MKRGFSLLFLLFVFHIFLNAKEIEVKSVDPTSFPTIKAKLWLRDSRPFNPKLVSLKEGDQVLKATFSPQVPVKPTNNGRCILLLIENHPKFPERTQFYIDALRKAEGFNSNDEVCLITFDCKRPEFGSSDREKQLLFPDTFKLSPESELDYLLSEITPQSNFSKTSECGNKSQIYTALYSALEKFSLVSSNKPKVMFTFCDDFSIIDIYKSEAVIEKSKQTEIPIFGFVFYQNIQRKYGIEEICKQSLGDYFLSSSDDNLTDEMAQNITVTLTSLDQRLAGIEVPFEFEALHQKDGIGHTITLKYQGEEVLFNYVSPKMTILEWAKANLWKAAGIVFGFLLFVALLIIYILHQRKLHRIKQDEINKANEELKRQREEAQAVNIRTNAEIEQMRKEAQAKEEAERRKTKAKEKEEQEKALISLMLERGAFPKLMYSNPGQQGFFEINRPELHIGRNPDNNLVINDVSVSKKHAQLTFHGGFYYLKDLGSTNGTFVNGDKISEVKLKHNDFILFGGIAVTFIQ